MLVGCLLLIGLTPWMPNGRIPFTLILFFELLAAFCVQLAAAVISESIGWTIGTMVCGNVFLNLFLMTLFRNPEFEAAIKSDTVTWTPLVMQIISCELACIALVLLTAIVIQTRKRSFI